MSTKSRNEREGQFAGKFKIAGSKFFRTGQKGSWVSLKQKAKHNKGKQESTGFIAKVFVAE